MTQPRPDLTEDQLLAWSTDLAEREQALAAEQVRFERYVADFQARAEQVVERQAETLRDALGIVFRAFPTGVTFEGWANRRDGDAVH
jgi:hypothetical protein